MTPTTARETASQTPQMASRRRRLALKVLVITGIAISLAAAQQLRLRQQEALRADISARTENLEKLYRTQVARESIARGTFILQRVRSSHAKRGELDRELFEGWGETIPSDETVLSRLFWAPRVTSTRARPAGPFAVWRGSAYHANREQALAEGDPLAPKQDAYPIRMVAAPERSPGFLEVDLASDEVLRAALQTGCRSGGSVVVGRPHLEGGGHLPNEWFHLAPAFHPRHLAPEPGSRCSRVAGFAGLISSTIVPPLTVGGMEHVLFELPPPEAAGATSAVVIRASFLSYFDSGSRPSWHTGPNAISQLGRSWILFSRPTPELVQAHRNRAPQLALLTGLLVTVLLSGVLLRTSRRLDRIEKLITKRTKALRASEERFKTMFECAPDPCYLLDLKGRILDANRAAEELFHFERAEVIGREVLVLGNLFESQLTAAHSQRRQGGLERFAGAAELTHEDPTGKHLVLETKTVPIDLKDRPAILGVARDVTEQKRAESALRKSEERYALAARGATDGLWDWDLVDDRIYFAARWKEMLGYSDDEIEDHPREWFKRVHPEDVERVRSALDEHLDGGSPHFESEHRVSDREGRYRWMLSRGIAVRDEGGDPTRLVGSQTDITERKTAEQQLQHDALHDALTGLPNRAFFINRLRHCLQARRDEFDLSFAVLFLDIDRFKIINDSLGHYAGDELLIAIAKRIQGCVRDCDTVARLGGDEFTILLMEVEDPTEARHVADRIQAALRDPFALESQEVFVTASIGITFGEYGYELSSHVLRDADTAMYRAKAKGKARYEVFTQNMRHQAVALLELETDLRRALERRQLSVYYQPIVDLRRHRICGFEALLRWHHPQRGVVLPGEFIHLAEDTGLIVPIGEWVLNESCAMARACLDFLEPEAQDSFWISVNLSPLQLKNTDIAAQAARSLAKSSVAAKHLKLEITETMVIEDAESEIETLHEVQSQGIDILLDDFGTGYSSLHYLGRFKINTLKIDRDFIDSELAAAVVTFAHSLGTQVVAEGIETQQQLKRIIASGCEFAQGYHFSQPVPEAVAQRLLRHHELPPPTAEEDCKVSLQAS